MLLWEKARGYDSLPRARGGCNLCYQIQTPILGEVSSTGRQVNIDFKSSQVFFIFVGVFCSLMGVAVRPKSLSLKNQTCVTVCGVAQQKTSGNRIIGGNNATSNEYPWQAYLNITFENGESGVQILWRVSNL